MFVSSCLRKDLNFIYSMKKKKLTKKTKNIQNLSAMEPQKSQIPKSR